ncbi:MAG: peroxidase [Verrucomicrobia bacterium]|nr:peroxidase [Verrucomicrobiota bacterium]
MNRCRNRHSRKSYLYLLAAGIAFLIFRQLRAQPGETGHRSLGSRLLEGAFGVVNRYVAWHKLPPWLGALNLISFREVLREKNLHDTSPPLPGTTEKIKCDTRSLYARRSDGTCNDLDHPEMGAAGQRFGRNVPRENTFPEKESSLLAPSPRVVSQRLLARESFVPAQSLNLLAAAWIQFQTHDWFAHRRAPTFGENDLKIPLEPEDKWIGGAPMHIPRTPADPTRTPEESGSPPTYINEESHWWDASQIYGDDPETTALLRDQGKLKIEGKDHLLPIDPNTHMPRTGFTQNWWIGLALLHTIFSREHNAIYDELSRSYPYWSQDQLFDTARLINTALMAKIHTVEWTPAILSHPTTKIALNANWWGLAGEGIHKVFGRIGSSELVSGIPGSPKALYGVPYALTEEFVSVYRLHPLIPERLTFWRVSDGSQIKDLLFPEVAFEKAQNLLDDGTTMGDIFYSFGISHPGAITLHNYPSFLRQLPMKDESGQYVKDEAGNQLYLDLASVDITRDRERGVPRYNEFLRLIHKQPVKTFEEITSNRVWAQQLREVYGGDVNRVDLMVGMFAEDLPVGFGFSDTAFRIFILMASRRLESDRYFTTDFRPEIYTQEGLDWITNNGMKSVLLRHYPELRPALREVDNAFAPWRVVG